MAGTREELDEELYSYVETWWSDWFDGDQPIPADREKAVQQYFEHTSEQDKGEWLDVTSQVIVIPWEGDV